MIWDLLNWVFIPTAAAQHRPAVVVSEIAWAGSSISPSDEWIELYSDGELVVDLSGWSLWDVSVDPAVQIVQIPDGQIAPKGHFLIGNNGPEHEFSKGRSVLSVQPDLIDASLSLSNARLALELRDASGEVVDRAGSGAAPLAGARSPHASMERQLDRVRKGTGKRAWVSANAQQGIDKEVSDFGSPTASGRPVVTTQPCKLLWDSGTLVQELPVVIVDPDPLSSIAAIRVNGVATVYGTPITVSHPHQLGKEEYRIEVDDSSGLSRTQLLQCMHVQTSNDLQISEVYAAPLAGEEEFIEVTNSGAKAVDLIGWQLGDKHDNQSYTIEESIQLMPGSSRAFFQTETKLRLNDTSEQVVLTDPSGKMIVIQVGKSGKGQSWSNAAGWGWSYPTPGASNRHLSVPSQLPIGQEDEPVPRKLSLAEFVSGYSELSPGVLVDVLARITVPIGVYGDRQLIVADGEWAAEVQLQPGEGAAFTGGELVRIVGTVSRAKTPKILAHERQVTLVSTAGGDYAISGQDYEPRLLQYVALTGNVESRDNRRFLVMGGREYQITRRQGIRLPEVSPGDILEVKGLIVSLDPLQVRVLWEGAMKVVSRQEQVDQLLLGTEMATVVTEEAREDREVSRIEQSAKPVVSDEMFRVLARTVAAMLAISTANAAELEAVHVLDTKADQVRLPLVGLITLFALLGALAILADWLWQILHTQSVHLANSGRSPPSL